MAKRKKKGPGKMLRLNSLANSPKFVRLFGLLIVALIIGAIGYGAFTLTGQDSSDAAKKRTYGPWYSKSSGIKHQVGQRFNSTDTLFRIYLYRTWDHPPQKGAKGPVWLADTSRDYNGIGQPHNLFVWDGPKVNIKSGKQYLGCFVYQINGHTDTQEGLALLDIYNSKSGKVYNKYWASDYMTWHGAEIFSGRKNITNQTRKKGAFARTCLAFYVPKSNTNNRISLRVKLYKGAIGVRKTKITPIKKKNYKLPNLKFLKHHDNSTIIQGSQYKG